jgi:hypothetical protein
MREFCDPPRIKAKPQPKPVYPPCKVKLTGRVLHPIDTPYWMQPRERQKELASKHHDPDRREVASVRLKNGQTKRQYRQMRAKPDTAHDVAWRAEYGAMMKPEQQRKEDVRAEPNKANGSASANVVILESQEAARRDFMSVSNVTRRALASDLRVRGLLADDEGEVIA